VDFCVAIPELDLVRVQDVGLMQMPDPEILEWAAGEGRVLLSHDVSTVPPAAYQRVAEAKPMPGVFILPDKMAVGQAIDEILFLSMDAQPNEWRDQVLYLPLSLAGMVSRKRFVHRPGE
jgi:hypothetical protein